MDFQEFIKERNEALLSMDKEKIQAYMRKWNDQKEFPEDEAFWAGVHKAITAIPSLPLEARISSKKWLEERGSESWDDGDIEGLTHRS